jgi:hypothetical protein
MQRFAQVVEGVSRECARICGAADGDVQVGEMVRDTVVVECHGTERQRVADEPSNVEISLETQPLEGLRQLREICVTSLRAAEVMVQDAEFAQ